MTVLRYFWFFKVRTSNMSLEAGFMSELQCELVLAVDARRVGLREVLISFT